jgi:hypothetical protein
MSRSSDCDKRSVFLLPIVSCTGRCLLERWRHSPLPPDFNDLSEIQADDFSGFVTQSNAAQGVTAMGKPFDMRRISPPLGSDGPAERGSAFNTGRISIVMRFQLP